MRRHVPSQQGLPLSMVSLDPAVAYRDRVSSLTTMVVTERCDGCAWPAVCEGDRTCWEMERGRDWSRSRADLRRLTR